MTFELICFIVSAGALLNILSLWTLLRFRDNNAEISKRIWARLNYLEVALSYHGLTPLPWEENDSENLKIERAFKEEGNVVYLQDKG